MIDVFNASNTQKHITLLSLLNQLSSEENPYLNIKCRNNTQFSLKKYRLFCQKKSNFNELTPVPVT